MKTLLRRSTVHSIVTFDMYRWGMTTIVGALRIAMLLATAGPAIAAGAATVAAVQVADVVEIAAAKPVASLPAVEIPTYVLVGMAVSGLLIVGIASRRRQTGRRVSS